MVDLNFLDFNFWNSGHMLHTWYSFSIITTAYSRQQLVKAITCFKHPDWLSALGMLFEDPTGWFNGAGWSKCSSEMSQWHQTFEWQCVCISIYVTVLIHYHIIIHLWTTNLSTRLLTAGSKVPFCCSACFPGGSPPPTGWTATALEEPVESERRTEKYIVTLRNRF